jgi:hypothetical protein
MLSSNNRLLTTWYKPPAESGRNGALQGQKELSAGAARSNLLKIAQDCLADRRHQRIFLRSPLLGACHNNEFTVPVEVIKL